MRNVNSAIKQTQSELRGVNTLLKLNPNSTELLRQKQKLLASAITDTKDKLNALKMTQEKINDGSIQATEAQYRDLEREIINTEAKLKGLVTQQNQLSSVASAQLQVVGKEFQALGQKITTAGNTLKPLSIAIAALSVLSLKTSIDFESSFAGVKKTVNATALELDKLREASRAMALVKPVDANDINRIMELGGQLNIATDYLDKFASVIGDLDVSTDMNIEDASLQLSQMMNICGTATEDIDRMGATIVGLGNNSATTESAIMDMAMRISGSGHQIGLTEAQILGLSASLASVGIRAEMGGSAISTIMSKIDKDVAMSGDDLAAWASAAGMSAQEFKAAWQNDAAGALTSLLAGMQGAVESGGNLNIILNDLGVTEIRKTDVLKRLTSASGLMTQTMDLANVAWQENNALTNEASQRYETSESKLKMLKNQIVDTGISIGNGLKGALVASINALKPFLSMISGGAKAFEHADPAIQNVVVSIAGFTASAAPLLIITGKLTSVTGTFITALGKSSAALVAKATATATDTVSTTTNTAATSAQILKNTIKEAMDARLAIKTNAKSVATTADTVATTLNTAATTTNATTTGAVIIKTVALSVATKAKAAAAGLATVAQLAWNAAMTANPVGAVVVAVAGLASIIGILTVAISSATKEQENLTVSSQRQKDKIAELQSAYDGAVQSQGEHSDAAVQAKYVLDQETVSFEASKETLDQFTERCSQTIQKHNELMTGMQSASGEADIQAGKVLYLSEQIATLSGIENKSAEEKANLTALTQTLNSVCSDLGLTYDSQTDSLNMNIDAIKAAAEAESNRLRSQSAMNSYSDLLDDQIKLEMQLSEAEENLSEQSSDVADKYIAMADESSVLLGRNDELKNKIQETKDALVQNAAQQQQALELSAKYSTKQSILALAIQEVASGSLTAEGAAQKYNDAVEGGITADEIRAQQAHDAAIEEERLAQMTNETTEAIKTYAEAHPSFQNALSLSGLSVEELSNILTTQDIKFEDAAKAIEEYSAKSASGFAQIADSSQNTLDILYQTLAYNLEATQNWGTNLEAVFGRTGVSFSQEFVGAVKAGGVEEYGTVMAQLAELSDTELQAISDAYASNGQAGVENYLSEQRLLAPGTKEALEETEETINNTLSSGKETAAQSGADTGFAYNENLKAEIASCPEDVQVYIQQLEEKLKTVEDPAAASGNNTGTNYTESLKAAIASSPVEVQAYIQKLEATLNEGQSSASSSGTTTGASYSANLKSSLATCPQEVQAYVQQLEAQLSTGSSKAATTGALTGTNYSRSLQASIATCPVQVQTYIAQLQGQLQQFRSQAGTIGSNTGSQYGSSTAAAMRTQQGNVSLSAASLKNSATYQLGSLPSFGTSTGTATGWNFAGGLAGQTMSASSASYALKSAAETPLGTVDGVSYGTNAGFGFGSGLYSTQAAVAVNANTIAACCNQWAALASMAGSWGWDAGSQFANGLRSTIGVVAAAAEVIASAASMRLHFSVPDVGPLSDADEYGPDFGMLFADGLRSKVNEIKKAASTVAQAAKDNITAPFQDTLDLTINSKQQTIPQIVASSYLGQEKAHLSMQGANNNAKNYTIYINGAKINDDAAMRAVTKDFLIELSRKGQM